jgi:hypothetical protein
MSLAPDISELQKLPELPTKLTPQGAAHLLAVEGGRWSVEATYD